MASSEFTLQRKINVKCMSVTKGPPEAYVNNSDRRGYVLIYNWTKFDQLENPSLQGRHGSNIDVMNVKELFTQVGYQVETHHDLTKQQLVENLANHNKNNDLLSKTDSAIAFFMSHGANDEFLTFDGQWMNYKEVCRLFNSQNCPSLVGKPKALFFIQCRGGGSIPLDGDVTDNGAAIIPSTTSFPLVSMSDMFVCFSTIDGEASYRHDITGSPFIQEMCAVFEEHAHNKSLSKLLQLINRNLHAKELILAEYRAIGCTKSFYLNPIGNVGENPGLFSNMTAWFWRSNTVGPRPDRAGNTQGWLW